MSIERAGAAAQQKIAGSGPAVLRFEAFGRAFDLQLEPNDRLLAAGGAPRTLTGDVAAFRGNVAGESASWVRIVIADGVPRGLMQVGGEMFAIEAPGDSAVQASSAVIYRLADTELAPGMLSCGVSTTGSIAEFYGSLVGDLSRAKASAPGAFSQIDLAAIGDFEFFEDKGGDSEAAILTRLNNIDGIYSEQLGVQIHVGDLEVFTSPADPFSDVTDAGALLDELSQYRVDTLSQRSQGLTHLYTGRNLDTTTVGIAFTDALCNPRFGAGLSESGSNATFDSLVAAHEIGHNFGAPHDGESGSACSAETGQFIMSATLNGSDQFSQCSIQQMQPRIAEALCITPLPTVDMTVSLLGALQPIPVGNSATVRFSVANIGTDVATDVALTVVIPANVSLDSAIASEGSCTSGAGTVDCQIGTIPGSSSRTVTLAVTAIEVGDGEFVATASANADVNLNNNEETVPVTVKAAAPATPPPTAGGNTGGGGGSTGLLALLALGSTALRRRRPRKFRQYPQSY